MHLWTEYEGRTIAGAYTLGKLLRSEGRNGFFATADPTGNSAVIRLTEAHFDEEEVLQRWRQVAALHGDHLIEIERVGQTNLDGVALTYALMENNDANLDDVLRERPLTTAETLEVAKGVLAALSTLHASGLVHEHVDPANVLAVGEVVKLRSDCVRACVADGEFTSEEACAEARKRDVVSFGSLLLRCLTLERELTPSTRLADPFNRIVPGAIEGTLSLRQLDAILNPPATPAVGSGNGYRPNSAVSSAPAVPVAPAAPTAPLSGVQGAVNGGPRSPLVPNGVRPAPPAAPTPLTAAARPLTPSVPPMAEPVEAAIPLRSRPEWDAEVPSGSALKPLWILGAVAALAVLWLLVHLFSAKASSSAATRPTPNSAASAPAPEVVVRPAPVPAASAGSAHALEAHAATTHGTGWYVVAYTYNYEAQARAKAARVNRSHSGFHPEVFSPTGHAPYLVSLGGPLTEGEAEALLGRARRSGLPRDTFVRRY